MATGTLNNNNYVILYDTSFQDGEVTLRDTIANYRYIEVIFGKNVFRYDNKYASTASGVLCSYGGDFGSSTNPGLIMSFLNTLINADKFKIVSHWRQFSYKNSSTPVIDNTLYNYITEIRGYK